MAKITFFISFFIIISTGVFQDEAFAQVNKLSSEVCKQNNQLVKKDLSEINPLLDFLEKNWVGDGLIKPWMAEIKARRIRHASADVYFELRNKSVTLRIDHVALSRQYYYSDPKLEPSSVLEPSERNALIKYLTPAFFIKAVEFLDSTRVKENSCGNLYLNLLDDACLPIINAIPYVDPKCLQ